MIYEEFTGMKIDLKVLHSVSYIKKLHFGSPLMNVRSSRVYNSLRIMVLSISCDHKHARNTKSSSSAETWPETRPLTHHALIRRTL